MALEFTPGNETAFQTLLSRYPTKQAALIPALYIAQNQFGHLSHEVMEYVAGRLELPTSKVLNTATFYTLLFKKPMGEYLVQVCTNVSCYLRGCDPVWSALKEKLGVGHGETTPDGMFTLEEVECVGSCGTAPVLQVNLDFHENITPEGACALIDTLRSEGPPKQKGNPGIAPGVG